MLTMQERKMLLAKALLKTRNVGNCWICDCNPRSRYPSLMLHYTGYHIHRLALEQKLGRPIKDGKFACHTRNCTSKRCINPDHLYEGDNKGNQEDRVIVNTPDNDKVLKYTDDEVREIFFKIVYLGLPQKEVAEEYGCHPVYAYHIATKKRRKASLQGKHKLNIDIHQISHYYGVSVNELVRRYKRRKSNGPN